MIAAQRPSHGSPDGGSPRCRAASRSPEPRRSLPPYPPTPTLSSTRYDSTVASKNLHNLFCLPLCISQFMIAAEEKPVGVASCSAYLAGYAGLDMPALVSCKPVRWRDADAGTERRRRTQTRNAVQRREVSNLIVYGSGLPYHIISLGV